MAGPEGSDRGEKGCAVADRTWKLTAGAPVLEPLATPVLLSCGFIMGMRGLGRGVMVFSVPWSGVVPALQQEVVALGEGNENEDEI